MIFDLYFLTPGLLSTFVRPYVWQNFEICRSFCDNDYIIFIK